MEFAKVDVSSFVYLGIGTVLFFAVPLLIAIFWTVRKKENFTSILIGAACFLLFALVLEKPIQNALILPDHAVSRFINARPVLWAFIVGLFPGVFEETGRFVAFKVFMKKRKNKETSISYGIGHGGIEVMLILGLTYATYISYAVMINTGMYQTVVDQVASQAPEQLEAVYDMAEQLATFGFADLAVAVFERIFSFLYHVGASILVFYACKDKKKFWLFLLAIVIHTIIDGMAGLSMKGVISLSNWQLEAFIALAGTLTFFGAYFLLYKRDK